MNLTVDQMDVLNFRLTEVSLELLGNMFYDIFGQKCDTLGSLYRSKSGRTDNAFSAESDLVAALKVKDIFNGYDVPAAESIRNGDCDTDENSGSSSDDESEDQDDNDDREQHRSDELTINRLKNEVEEEYTRLLMHSENIKMKYFITNKHRMETEYSDEYDICRRFHIKENADLMAQSDAFIKIIKYIKCDGRNASKMGKIAANILKVKDHISDAANAE